MMQTLPDPPPPAEPPIARPRRLRWIVTGAVAAVLLAGTGIAYGIYTARDRPPQRFAVTVYLEPGVGADKRAAIEDHLRELDSTIRPEFKDAGELTADAAELYTGNPEMLDRVSGTALPAILVATYELRRFRLRHRRSRPRDTGRATHPGRTVLPHQSS